MDTLKKRCRYVLEVDTSKDARSNVNNSMYDRGISDYKILRVQRCNLAHPDYCERIGYKVYVEYAENENA